jgi:hypothetical protein
MKKVLVLTVLLAVMLCCSGWGGLVHRTTLQLAVYALPAKMQPFFFDNLAYLVKNSVRPDQRRRSDPAEATRHFIDLEAFGPNAATEVPERWEDAVTRFTEDTLRKYGTVPWRITAVQARLTEAFRRRNADSIRYFAADLGHYLGDAHVPLHTSLNYDGQLSNQHGLHALWESTVPELFLNEYQLYEKHGVRYLKNPQRAAWEAVRSGHELLRETFEQERDVTRNFTDSTKYRIQRRNGIPVKYYTTAFARAYGQRVNPSVQRQLRRSVAAIADFWYTAWVDGGRPDLDDLLKTPLSPEQKKRLKAERAAYRANELLAKGWLRARSEEDE